VVTVVRQPTPESLPILSRGKHRNPRKGACFMEMASVLGGERWSDHPACTHALLAHLARLVNDHTTDAGRDRLAILIPSVVGLTGGGDRWVVGLTGQVALHALPDVPEHAQRALAAGLLRVRQLQPVVGAAPLPRDEELEAALARVPSALRWLRRFDVDRPIAPRTFVSRAAPSVVTAAVVGLAECGPDPDARLRELLVVGIDAAEVLQRFEAPAPAAPERRGTQAATRPR
jgi:hypothetical protein